MIYARLAAAIAIIAALTWLYSAIDQRGYDRAQAEYTERMNTALLAYAKTITTAGEQHDKDQDTINRLSAAGRVRIKFPVCPSTQAGTDQDGSAGVFSDRMDEIFGEFQARTGRIIDRCAKLNIDAIELNSICSR